MRAGIPQKKGSSHHGQQKSPKCSTWMQSKNDRMISVRFQGKPFNITVIQVYAPTSNTEEEYPRTEATKPWTSDQHLSMAC